jgi:hypothetical protein
MAKTKTAPKEEAAVAVAEEVETRVDEFSIDIFKALGFSGRLPDGLVAIFNDYKRSKDTLNPGRASAEGYAAVVTIYRLLSADA